MLSVPMNQVTFTKLYNWVTSALVREKRDEMRMNVLLAALNEQLVAQGKDPISFADLDKDMGFDERGMQEKRLDYFNLDLDSE